MKNITIPKWATYGILFVMAFLFVFLFSCTTSPLYEHHPFWFHGDSGIFQEMGICLLQGGTPYVDLFDHKGPLLWFFQAIGIGISPRWGLMALQSVSLFVTLILWYKSVSLLINKPFLSLLATFIGLILLMCFYQRGNLSEEWSLPFISLPILLYLSNRGDSNNSKVESKPLYSHKECLYVGLCVGALAMIRLNNTAPIIGFALWHFAICIRQKEIKRLWKDVFLLCCGVAIVFILCSSYYLLKAGWYGVYEMIYGTFLFNFIYIKNEGSGSLVTLLQNHISIIGFLIIAIICGFRDNSLRNLTLPVIISYIVTLFSMGKQEFLHYTIISIPMFVITIAIIFRTSNYWTFILLGFILLYSIYLGYNAIDHLIFRLRGKQANTEINDGFHQFIKSIPSEDQKSIYNAGLNHLGAGLFVDENIYQCNRIIYKRHSEISLHLREYELTHSIKDLLPIWVLTQSPRPETTDEYMKTNYILTDSIPGGQFDPIWCWKKK